MIPESNFFDFSEDAEPPQERSLLAFQRESTASSHDSQPGLATQIISSEADQVRADSLAPADGGLASPPPPVLEEVIVNKVREQDSGFHNRRGGWWKNERGMRVYTTDLRAEGDTVWGRFEGSDDIKIVPIHNLSVEELPAALEGIFGFYNPAAAAAQIEHPILFDGLQ